MLDVGWGTGDQLANAGNCPYPVTGHHHAQY